MTPRIVENYDLSEFEFYLLYFEIQNIKREKKQKLTPTELELAATICTKPLNFHIDTKKAPKGRSRKYELGLEMGQERTAIYFYLGKLVEKGILTESSDGFLELPDTVQKIRKAVKLKLEQGKFNFDYVFNFNIHKGQD